MFKQGGIAVKGIAVPGMGGDPFAADIYFNGFGSGSYRAQLTGVRVRNTVVKLVILHVVIKAGFGFFPIGVFICRSGQGH